MLDMENLTNIVEFIFSEMQVMWIIVIFVKLL